MALLVDEMPKAKRKRDALHAEQRKEEERVAKLRRF